jgi:hypothetical protein
MATKKAFVAKHGLNVGSNVVFGKNNKLHANNAITSGTITDAMLAGSPVDNSAKINQVEANLLTTNTAIRSITTANETARDTSVTSAIAAQEVLSAAARAVIQTDVDTKFNTSGGTIAGATEVTGHVTPSANNTYDLGSPAMVWRDVHIGPGSLYVNGSKVIEDSAGTIIVSADLDQSLTVKTQGTGETTLQSASGVNLTATGSADVTITTTSGNIEAKGNLQILTGKKITDSASTKIEFGDNIDMNNNKVTEVATPTSGTDAANKTYVDTAVADVVNSAPAALDTLNELSAALGADANFATTVSTNLGQKLGSTASVTLSGDVSGTASFSANAVSITTVIADDSHNHVISNVDGLQTALDTKATSATVSTNETNRDASVTSAIAAQEVLSAAARSTIQSDVDTKATSATVAANETARDTSEAAAIAAQEVLSAAARSAIQSDVNANELSSDNSHTAATTDRALIRSEMATNETARDTSEAAAISTAVANLVDVAPAALDTLNELAASLNDDADFAGTMTTALGSATTDRAAIRSEVAANETARDASVTSAIAAQEVTSAAARSTIQSDVDANELSSDNSHIAATTDRALIRSEMATNETNRDSSVTSAIATQEALSLTARNAIQSDVDANESSSDSSHSSATTDRALIRTEMASNETARDSSVTSAIAAQEVLSAAARAVIQTDVNTKTTSGYVDTQITNLIGGAPGTLDTLNELAAAINDDSAYASTLTTALATKTAKTSNQSLGSAADVMTISGHTITLARGDGTTDAVTVPDNNTTYSVTNGQLSEINFTSADNTKLDGIATGATNVTNNNQLTNGAGYITGYTDTNTTYSAGAGLDLSGTTFSVETDLRDGITHIGRDSNDYINIATTTQSFFLDGGERMRVVNNGDIHADGDMIAYSTTISDKRLKENIQTIEGAVDKVKQLTGCTFTYIADGKESAGLIAQDVEKVLPSAVSEKELPLKMDDGIAYKTVQYDQTIGLLVEAIKEQQVQIEELQAKLK